MGAAGGTLGPVRVGIADHFGWAVVVTASPDHVVVDRRRIELIEPGLPAAPIHHLGGAHELHAPPEPLDDAALAVLVADVRAAVARVAAAALDDLAAGLSASITSISLRTWPADFPRDIAVLRRVPYESRADAVMYRQVLAELGAARGWDVVPYTKDVERTAAELLGRRADAVLHGPRRTLGPPWAKDHRAALAATVVAAAGPGVSASR